MPTFGESRMFLKILSLAVFCFSILGITVPNFKKCNEPIPSNTGFGLTHAHTLDASISWRKSPFKSFWLWNKVFKDLSAAFLLVYLLKSKREHFLIHHLKSFLRSPENHILEFQIFKFYGVMNWKLVLGPFLFAKK